MKRIIFLLFIASLIVGCKSTNELITIDGHTFEEFLAPRVSKISTNFYADEVELTNIDYKEFMYWTKQVFGEKSPEYSQIILDTTVWNAQDYYDSLNISYFQNPKYNFHPVVGVSLEQAKIYSNWRTERVAEMLLIHKKLVKANPNQNRDNYFTIEKYLNGNYEATIKIEPNLALPIYTIPTIEEWETISAINSNFKFGIDSLDKHNKRLIKNNSFFFNTKELSAQQLKKMDKLANDQIKYVPTIIANSGYKNKYGLKNTIGNVSELVAEPGISKGGDWSHFLVDIDSNKSMKNDSPNCWTGFRNVCKFEVRKRKEGS